MRSGDALEALRQLNRLRSSENSPWRRTPPAGRMRGIDFYPPGKLVWVMASAMRRFRRKHGRYPSIVSPMGFNEKVFWFKFFGEIPVPCGGDKLSTHRFIPQSLLDQLQCAPLVWQSNVPKLPDNNALPPGIYYLKANLGCGMFERITYPLTDELRLALEERASVWLRSRFGFDDGEWWYNTFEPKLLIERSVCGTEDAISWNFYVLNGHIPMVGMFVKHADGTQESSWLDASFQPLPWQSALPPVKQYRIPDNCEQMLHFAREVARPFSAVRVDFLQGSDGRTYLCELTFSPGNALSRRPPEVDALLSKPWKMLR
ncbi:hypothetical protein GTZ97_02610 [Aquabacterium fontiphilum]|uniref:ATP-grasp fold amidoligase family protein n=1 Tax=Aquabacterium fontiphilum TaxID=450365 RepID=UPI001377D460|nr:ATP-grasp fold amidoligase family protein [Aquabacterium fontiphilum]NBD19566.1 hypothetical protein [Aquabacterium fontiphilum]